MSNYFNQKFKQLRKKSDLTQEQIAEIFNVSPQSVSRWETGANYPDIEILPHIAVFFKVTVDELLGTEEIQNEKKAADYTRDIRNILNSGKLYDAIELARTATKEYPFNNRLCYLLIQALSVACFEQTPGHEENTAKFKDEIIAISERIINLSDYKESLSHRVQLVQMYAKWGMKDDAKRLFNTLPPDIWDTQEPWEGLVLDDEEMWKKLQHRIIRARYLLEYLMRQYLQNPNLDTLQKIEFRKAKMQIESLIDSIGYDNASDNHLELALEYIIIAELYCKVGDAENALEYVEKATQGSMHHIDYMDKTNPDGSNYMPWSTPRNLCWIMWEDHLAKPEFDFIRDEERFIQCFKLLQANSCELK